MTLTIDDFIVDPPTALLVAQEHPYAFSSPLIDGVTIAQLSRGSDARGRLNELLSFRAHRSEPIEHIYQVHAEPGSLRAWVFHRFQDDRLAFTEGQFRVVLYDIRRDSPTCGLLNVLEIGDALQCRLRIPKFVVHGVQNFGTTRASFVNMPTTIYDPMKPDKCRLPADHPGIPYRFP